MGVDRKRGVDMPEKRFSWVVNFLIRSVVGIAMIFFVNEFLAMQNIDVSVGINPISVVTSGALGTPGVALLYGIIFYKGL